MIIGRQFAWAHLPKTGGDATYELFKLFPELIVFAHPRETNEKHNVFATHREQLDGKLLAMNIRRLPSWMLSMSQHQAHYGLHPEHKHPPLDSKLMSSSSAADHALKSFMDNGLFHIDLWVRTEYLIDDFLVLIARFVDVSPEKEKAVRSMNPVNQMSYNHQIDRWFTAEQLETIYEANPLWASVEQEMYGNLLVSEAAHEEAQVRTSEKRRGSRVRLTRLWKQPIGGSGVVEFQLDAPSAGWATRGCNLPIHGWIVAEQDSPVVIEATVNENRIKTCKAEHARPDVGKNFPRLARAGLSGFVMQIGMMGLPKQFQLTLNAVLATGARVCLTILEINRAFEPFTYRSSLQPIMITTGGRTGSSWLMRILSQHPDIVIRPPHPYETQAAVYWLHMVKVLADPADHHASTPRINFTGRRNWVGHHPFFAPQVTQQCAIREWFEYHYPDHLAALAQRSIDEFYQNVGTSLGKDNAVYFAEKCGADHVPWLAWELYSETREIVLVRDFRDAMSSIFAFSERNGNRGFGRGKVESKEEYIRRMRTGVMHLLQGWELRSDRALLVRYEDLVGQTERVVEEVMEYLGLDANVPNLIELASRPNERLVKHRTVDSAIGSIGRWRRDLDGSLQAACETAFQEALVAFGYE